MGGGRKRACLLLLPEVPQGGQNFYEIEFLAITQKKMRIQKVIREVFEVFEEPNANVSSY